MNFDGNGVTALDEIAWAELEAVKDDCGFISIGGGKVGVRDDGFVKVVPVNFATVEVDDHGVIAVGSEGDVEEIRGIGDIEILAEVEGGIAGIGGTDVDEGVGSDIIDSVGEKSNEGGLGPVGEGEWIGCPGGIVEERVFPIGGTV